MTRWLHAIARAVKAVDTTWVGCRTLLPTRRRPPRAALRTNCPNRWSRRRPVTQVQWHTTNNNNYDGSCWRRAPVLWRVFVRRRGAWTNIICYVRSRERKTVDTESERETEWKSERKRRDSCGRRHTNSALSAVRLMQQFVLFFFSKPPPPKTLSSRTFYFFFTFKTKEFLRSCTYNAQ